MIVEDTLIIAGVTVLGSAIAAMWVYYNKRITAMETRIAKLEQDRLADYKAHLATANKLTDKCVQAIDRFTDAINALKREIKET